MSALRLSAGQSLAIGPKLGEGGQGTVYEIRGSEDHVAKLFRRPVDGRDQRKLVAVVRLGTVELARAAAWPTDLIYNTNGACVGLVMPRVVRAKEIDRLAHPAEQRLAFPTIDYGFLLHVALNLARAAASIHSAGCVIGDVNERNVLVLADGTVRFIDVDSFQVVAGGEVFTCPVGSELFTAPELRGRTLANEQRTSNHDAFGLAVLIFQLLMLGRHPFAGIPKDGQARTIEEAIRDGLYAYTGNNTAPVSPPPDTIAVTSLGSLADLFRRAFTSQTRPSAAEWMYTLDRERSRLRRCEKNARHAVLQGVCSCPLCALRRDPMPADAVVMAGPDLGPLSIAELLAEAGRLDRLRPLELRCSQPVIPPGHRYIRGAPPTSSVKVWGFNIGAAGVAIALFCPLSTDIRLSALAIGVAVGLCAYGIGKVQETGAASRFGPLKQTAEESIRRLESVEQQATALETGIRAQTEPLWTSIREACESLSTAEPRLSSALAHADRSWTAHKLDEHLRHAVIRHARIPGIGPSRTALLASFGIETAADVDQPSLRRVPGFGQELTRRVLNWRSSKEQEFLGTRRGSAPHSWVEQLKRDHQQQVAASAARLRRDAQEYVRRWATDDRRLADAATAIDAARSHARSALLALG